MYSKEGLVCLGLTGIRLCSAVLLHNAHYIVFCLPFAVHINIFFLLYGRRWVYPFKHWHSDIFLQMSRHKRYKQDAGVACSSAVRSKTTPLTLSEGLVSPALWPSHIWSCKGSWSSSGWPAGPLLQAGSAHSRDHPGHKVKTHRSSLIIDYIKTKLQHQSRDGERDIAKNANLTRAWCNERDGSPKLRISYLTSSAFSRSSNPSSSSASSKSPSSKLKRDKKGVETKLWNNV